MNIWRHNHADYLHDPPRKAFDSKMYSGPKPARNSFPVY